ncbi:MAG: Gfo/Idh/MocA family oxidoreductase [SAR202 cluster bacterium]|nr:Gfo/Idh/MocA family oxidoreductase [SAR202 cluster bacterium]
MTRNAQYKVGMVGCGRQGTQHARGFTLHPSTEVVAIADPDPENLELACKRFNARGYSSSEEMYRNEKLDIVDCVLPVSINPTEVIKAAELSGAKGIVSEKPIAALLSDADRMVAACASRGIPWQGGNVDRCISQLWEAKRLIDSGEIGEVKTINLYEKTMQGGVQGISVIQMFAGDADVEWVTGWTNGDPFGEGDDDYQGIGGYIRFKNGIECFVHASPIAMRGLSVLGTNGTFVTDKRNHAFYKKADGSDKTVLSNLKRDDTIKFKPMRSHAEGGRDAEGWEYPGDRLMGCVQSIVDAVEKGVEPRCPGYIHRKSLEISIAMRESARRNHSPVRLPLVSRNYRMLPEKYRWMNKKELYGKEWYAEQIGEAQKKG